MPDHTSSNPFATLASIQVTVTSGICTLALNKPETRNAIDDGMVDDLMRALAAIQADETIRCVVFRSTHDKVFSAGGNLNAFAQEESAAAKYARNRRFPELTRKLMDLRVPVLCALDGHVLAGGLGLVMACDLVIAKAGVRIGTPEINIGAFPFMISPILQRNMPFKKLAEMVFLGEQIPVEEAVALGIVNKVVSADTFEQEVADWAGKIAGKSPLLIKLGKQALHEQKDMALSDALALLQHYLTLAQGTADVKEGVAAFMEKREPNWRGE